MKKYRVEIQIDGSVEYNIGASNEEEAEAKAVERLEKARWKLNESRSARYELDVQELNVEEEV